MARYCNPCIYHIMNTDGVWISFDKVVLKPGKRQFDLYRKQVQDLTELQPLHELEGIEKRGFRDHHIDHKISIWHGYKNAMDPEQIAHISNLRMLPYKENMRKGKSCA